VLSPEEYLVYGVAVAVGGAVVAATYTHLGKAATTFRKLLSLGVTSQMNQAVAAAAIQQAEQRGEIIGEPVKAADDEEKFDARDLFNLLNQDEDNTLSIAEFKGLFDLLDINLSEEKQNLLVAICDDDCSQTIDQEEFTSSWEYLQEIFVEEAVSQAGLGQFEIVMSILILLLLLLSMFFFIFMAIAAWSNQTDFMAVIRSLIVTALGGLVTVIRPGQTIATDDEEQKRQVKEHITSLHEQDGD